MNQKTATTEDMKELRAALGKYGTHQQIAFKARVSVSLVSKFMTGARGVSPKMLKKIRRAIK